MLSVASGFDKEGMVAFDKEGLVGFDKTGIADVAGTRRSLFASEPACGCETCPCPRPCIQNYCGCECTQTMNETYTGPCNDQETTDNKVIMFVNISAPFEVSDLGTACYIMNDQVLKGDCSNGESLIVDDPTSFALSASCVGEPGL